jgi:alpha-glucosidase
VPTAWDETRFISGEPGQDIVLARRHGKTWYIGAMTGEQARTQKVSLGFLPAGNWRATIWQDGEVVREVRRTERKVTRKDILSLALAAAGGAVVVLEPLPAP